MCCYRVKSNGKVYTAGEVFNVPGNSEFNLQIVEPTSYLCRYL
ncbi:Protein of uncharacterised function (DUF1255) [Kluyvera cryocrescens]|uniref:Protein of uncharacterized function (DUF1255) n=1 Tax=Kluyvera cryocrescens TaxID=580 RepID=A0A485D3K2_KLUCR|nr:Protein of uncharacterised function (DUF1255) [Kluyvera cryocrescens]